MGEQWIVCQSIGVARHYGWSIAVGKDDVICSVAAIAFGFRSPNDEYLRGFASVGTYDYVCVAPLNRLRRDRSNAYDQRTQGNSAVHWRSRVWHGPGQ
jgi:hypothetical protein